jgi:hypothetical protein
MSSAESFAQLMADLEALRLAVLDNAPSLPDVQRAQAAFELILPQIKETKARQDSLTAARQETTQTLNKLLVEVRDLAIRLRAVVKSNLGPKSERLVQFGVAPLRKRTRKPATQPPAATPAEPVTPTPTAPAPPATKPAA